MADIKTVLRETSVIVGINDIVLGNNVTINYQEYCKKINLYFDQKAIEAMSVLYQVENFNPDLQKILVNGYKLANKIIEYFEIVSINEINWHGFDSQKEDPIDITINGLGFSLKEDSFILENMGLYKLVNLFTGSTFKKMHIFEDFSPIEYKDWFHITWQLLIQYLQKHGSWRLHDSTKNKTSIIYIEDRKVYLIYNVGGYREEVKLKIDIDITEFEEKTSSMIREQVFSKWINNIISNDEKYILNKKICSEKAAENLQNYLLKNLNYNDSIARFLRIHDKEYYYAKVTQQSVELYRVPSIDNYRSNIVIDSIIGSVPKSQVNIITVFRNISSNETISIRNECRFSHGQFNGTPEAKMYYDRGNSLLAIYDKIL